MKLYLPVAPEGVMTQENTRPTYVPDDFDELQGPTNGCITLPVLLDWTPSNTYDLESPQRVKRLYETVLSEASSERDIVTYIDKTILLRSWRYLRLPRRVRYAWETVHPELREQC